MVEGYSDADWNSGSDDCKSTSGYIFSMAGGAVSWKSKKQTCIAHSTMESELVALATAGEEAEWIKTLLIDISFWVKPVPPISIHCDSLAAIGRANNKCYNGKSRQIRLKHGCVRQLLKNGVITLDFIRSNVNIADPLTKALAREKVWKTSKEMGLKPIEK